MGLAERWRGSLGIGRGIVSGAGGLAAQTSGRVSRCCWLRVGTEQGIPKLLRDDIFSSGTGHAATKKRVGCLENLDHTPENKDELEIFLLTDPDRYPT